ncbi:C2 domain [Trinorchestia longiramus]|nr:C2 domain [Trinorchestia longiramus]
MHAACLPQVVPANSCRVIMPSLGEKLELSFSASKLKNKDMMSKSDPFLVVALSEGDSSEAKEVGRTEVIKDNLNPVWMTKFIIDYHFEARQEQIYRAAAAAAAETAIDLSNSATPYWSTPADFIFPYCFTDLEYPP